MRLVCAEDASGDPARDPDPQRFPRTLYVSEGSGVFFAGKGARLEPLQAVLYDGEQVIVEYTGRRSRKAPRAVLKLNGDPLPGASPLNSVGMAGIAGLLVAVVQRRNIRRRIVWKGSHCIFPLYWLGVGLDAGLDGWAVGSPRQELNLRPAV
jgi:hypothetical protein